MFLIGAVTIVIVCKQQNVFDDTTDEYQQFLFICTCMPHAMNICTYTCSNGTFICIHYIYMYM